MELRHLRSFVIVAEELHFGRAALRLHISQPPLSRQIQELEEELGFTLFTREYHKVTLTDAGRVYLAGVKATLERLGAVREDAAAVARGRRGHLRIGSGAHLPHGFLPGLLARFGATQQIEVDILEAPSPRTLHALLDRSIDVGFVMLPVEKRGLIVKELIREPLVLVLPSTHPLANRPLESLSRLAHESWVACRRFDEPGYRELVESLCASAGFAPRVHQAVEHRQTLFELVAGGLGVAIVPWSERQPSERLAYVAFPEPAPVCATGIAWREDTPHAPLIEALVDLARLEAARVNASLPARLDELLAATPHGARLTVTT